MGSISCWIPSMRTDLPAEMALMSLGSHLAAVTEMVTRLSPSLPLIQMDPCN